MTAYLAAIELRRRWRSIVLLALLVAVVVAVVVASVAGARRSSTAFDRYLDRLNAPDAMAFGDPAVRERIADLDAVQETVVMDVMSVFPLAGTDEDFYPMVTDPSGRLLREVFRMPVVAGRLPDPAEPLEVALSERTAERLGLAVGDSLPVGSGSPEATEHLNETGEFDADGPSFDLTVVGVVRDPGDVGGRRDEITLTFLSPSFRDAYGPEQIGTLSAGTAILVRPGHALSEVAGALEGGDVELDTSFFTPDGLRRQLNPTAQAIGTALYVFAAIVALAGLAAVAQAVARLQQAIGDDDRTLAALGCGRRTRWGRLITAGGAAVVGGTVLGVGGAALASPLFPVGLARRAEPDPGFHLDATALLAGTGLALAAGLLVVGALAAWRVHRPALGAPVLRMSALGRAAARSGAPTAVTSGLSLTSGTPGAPGRAAVGGVLLGVLGVLATFVFGASVDRLRASPELYGWGWDAVIEGADLRDLGDQPLDTRALVADRDLAAVGTVMTQLSVAVDGTPLFATSTHDVRGHLRPVMVQGEEPLAVDQIALGRDTADQLGVAIGSTVRVALEDDPVPMTVSGIVALPVPADGGSSATGAFFSGASADALGFDGLCERGESCSRAIGLALRDGVDPATIVDRYRDVEREVDVYFPTPPGEVERLTAVQDLPVYLAGFLALLAAVAVSFAAAMTVRRRRGDLAVLRVLGMTAAQLRTAVTVFVLALTFGAALAGTLLGLVAGRQVWHAVAASVSLPSSPSIPVVAALAAPVGAILLAEASATLSRRAAGRTRTAMVLRTE